MADVLLSLVMPSNVAQHVEDLLLNQRELPLGFTATTVEGHGTNVPLHEASEMVSGHAARVQIQLIGSEADMRAVLTLIKTELPRAHVFYWLVPVIEAGRL